jgi:hypothetical protein
MVMKILGMLFTLLVFGPFGIFCTMVVFGTDWWWLFFVVAAAMGWIQHVYPQVLRVAAKPSTGS